MAVHKIAHYVSVSREMMDGISRSLDDMTREPTPEEVERRRAAHEREEAELQTRLARHRQLMVTATGLLRDVLDLHGPAHGHYPRWVCEGCDAEGYDVEFPAWPCQTYELAVIHADSGTPSLP